MINEKQTTCLICGDKAKYWPIYRQGIYHCDTCSSFTTPYEYLIEPNRNILAPYLYHDSLDFLALSPMLKEDNMLYIDDGLQSYFTEFKKQ